jgi:ketosteroid isomerase-like protein
MSVEANKAIVRRYFKAIEEADYDTLYAFRALFEPAGITERGQVTWLPEEGGWS